MESWCCWHEMTTHYFFYRLHKLWNMAESWWICKTYFSGKEMMTPLLSLHLPHKIFPFCFLHSWNNLFFLCMLCLSAMAWLQEQVKTQLSVNFCALLFPWPWPCCRHDASMGSLASNFDYQPTGPTKTYEMTRSLVMVTLPRFPHIPLTNLIHFHHDVRYNPNYESFFHFFFKLL